MSGSCTPESCSFLELSLQHTTINQVIRRTRNLYKPEQLLLRCDIFSVSYLSASLAHTELRTEMSFPTYSHRQFTCHKIQTFFHLSKILALRKEVQLTTSPPNQQLFRVPFPTLFIQDTEPSPKGHEFSPHIKQNIELLCAGGSRALSKTLPAASHSKRR